MILNIYSDGSHCSNHRIGASSYLIFLNSKIMAHEVILIECDNSLHTEFFAAYSALLLASKMFGYIGNVNIYFDCSGVNTIINNGKGCNIFKRKYPSATLLYNIISEYKNNNSIIRGHQIKAHTNLLDKHSYYNRTVDIAARKALRELRNKKTN